MSDRTQDLVQVYQGEDGHHYWRRIAPNGNVVADSGEGYVDASECRRMATEVNAGCLVQTVKPG
jgi:uncharacterized protein YegP (UPF0339 family)